MAALSFYQGLRALGLKSKNPSWICFSYFEGCFFRRLGRDDLPLEWLEPFNPLTTEGFGMKLPCEA
jgi:hypothetical protein